jgi:hypothetical protein
MLMRLRCPGGREEVIEVQTKRAAGVEPFSIDEAVQVVQFYLHLTGLGFHESPVAKVGLGRGGWTTAPLLWCCTVGSKLAKRRFMAPPPFRMLPYLEAYWLAAAAEDTARNETLPALERQVVQVERYLDAMRRSRHEVSEVKRECARLQLVGLRGELEEQRRRLGRIRHQVTICWKARSADGTRRLYHEAMAWLAGEFTRCGRHDPSFVGYRWPLGRG